MSAENCRDCEELESDIYSLRTSYQNLSERFDEMDKARIQAQESLKDSKKEHHRQRSELRKQINRMQLVIDAADALVAVSDPIPMHLPPHTVALRVAEHQKKFGELYAAVRKYQEEKKSGL